MIFRTVLIILAALVLFALINYYNTKQKSLAATEKFWEEPVEKKSANTVVNPYVNYEGFEDGPVIKKTDTAAASVVVPAEEDEAGDFRAVEFSTQKLPSDCFPKDRLSADDLLPKDAANSKWAQVNPAGQGDVKDQNFLSAGYMIGINTIGSSLKNANLQLRSEPVIPKVAVGPFLNSSYEASDVLRRPLEIGGDC